jgi:hypothetical protein
MYGSLCLYNKLLSLEVIYVGDFPDDFILEEALSGHWYKLGLGVRVGTMLIEIYEMEIYFSVTKKNRNSLLSCCGSSHYPILFHCSPAELEVSTHWRQDQSFNLRLNQESLRTEVVRADRHFVHENFFGVN